MTEPRGPGRPRKYKTITAKRKAATDRAMAWYEQNRDHALEVKAKWRQENKDKIRKYREKNRDRIALQQNLYYLRVTKPKRDAARKAKVKS